MPAQLTPGRSTGELAPVPFTQVDSQRLLVRTEKQTREDTDCTCLPVLESGGYPVPSGPALTQPASLSSRPLTAGVAVSGLPGHAGLMGPLLTCHLLACRDASWLKTWDRLGGYCRSHAKPKAKGAEGSKDWCTLLGKTNGVRVSTTECPAPELCPTSA